MEKYIGEGNETDTMGDWWASLEGLHARIAHRFARAELRERVRRYLSGLLGNLLPGLRASSFSYCHAPPVKGCRRRRSPLLCVFAEHAHRLSPIKAFVRRIPGAEVLGKVEAVGVYERRSAAVIGKEHRSGVFLCLKNDVPLSREVDREAVPLVFEDADDAFAKLLEAGDEEGSVTEIAVEQVIQQLRMAGFNRVLYKPSGAQHLLEMDIEALAFLG